VTLCRSRRRAGVVDVIGTDRDVDDGKRISRQLVIAAD